MDRPAPLTCYDCPALLDETAVALPGFGEACPSCVAVCPDGFSWPRSIAQDSLLLAANCAGCMRRATQEVAQTCV